MMQFVKHMSIVCTLVLLIGLFVSSAESSRPCSAIKTDLVAQEKTLAMYQRELQVEKNQAREKELRYHIANINERIARYTDEWNKTGCPGNTGRGPTPYHETDDPIASPTQLAGTWHWYVKGKRSHDCVIEQNGQNLVFRILQNPEPRSTGRFLDANTVVAEEWKNQRGTVSADGNRIDWPTTYWVRASTGGKIKAPVAQDSGRRIGKLPPIKSEDIAK
ncbi:MAG TPA: hypothetical protein VN328_10885 [Thermodesulfovibrionales bacterium]|nr:hypothetical protein [Thermodesulfovibrionales bacterium]